MDMTLGNGVLGYADAAEVAARYGMPVNPDEAVR